MPHVTIIETGLVSPKNRERHGSYPQMFEAMIAAADPSVTFDTISIPAGEKLPVTPSNRNAVNAPHVSSSTTASPASRTECTGIPSTSAPRAPASACDVASGLGGRPFRASAMSFAVRAAVPDGASALLG